MIELKQIGKDYRVGDSLFCALRNINLTIESGEFVAITGASGSGKSTLMNLIGCLDRPDRGEYFFKGKLLNLESDDHLSVFRNSVIGFVFQMFNLIPRLNALRNVELPLIYAGVPVEERIRRAKNALQALGLQEHILSQPSRLSGGQQQRVAIARALVNNPELIIADEPTGSLDSKTAGQVMDMLRQLNQIGKTIVFVTHDLDLTAYASRVIEIKDGQILRDERK